jgi:hypothetical protein
MSLQEYRSQPPQDHDEAIDPDYEQGADVEYNQGPDPDYDESGQGEFADSFTDSEKDGRSKEWVKRSQK